MKGRVTEHYQMFNMQYNGHSKIRHLRTSDVQVLILIIYMDIILAC